MTGPSDDGQAGVTQFCDAQIWPTWAIRWVTCGSALRSDGRCVKYGHVRTDRRAAEEGQR